jgi:hypothetical protein
MSTVTTNLPPVARGAARPRRPLVVAAAAFAVTAVFDLIARPPAGNHPYHAASMYTFTALLIPFALGMLWALADLRSGAPAGDRLATVGFRAAATGLILFVPCAIASLATANPQALGPVYVIAMLLSLVGTGVLSIALARAGALPVWAALALPVAWLLCGPVGEGGAPVGFRGAALILAAVTIAVGRAAARRTSPA